jgi:16S rRNA (guanine527-N7)-methyltransferase
VENPVENFSAQKIYLNDFQLKATKAHFEILMKWKDVHNLTSLTSFEDMYWSHYVDCFQGLQALDRMYPSSALTRPAGTLSHKEREIALPATIYDLGSGAGFPGLLAAVWWPDKEIVLVESSKKKCSFLSIACQYMGLNRVKVLGQRTESLKNIEFAITRAAFSEDNWDQIKPCLAPEGRVAFWLSGKQSKIKPGWVLDKEEYYELEPGHQREIAVFHVKH